MTRLHQELSEIFDALMFPTRNAQTYVPASGASSYPPYNLIRLTNTEAVLEVAVAGFKESEVSVTVEDGYLKVSGRKESTDEQPDYLYKGIGARAFDRAFTLSKDAKVTAAEYADGILSVFVTYELPEEKKPKQIPITRGERLYLTE